MNNNINRIVEEQHKRFSSIPTHGTIQNRRRRRRNSPPPPPPSPQQPIPQTIILECNRLTSRQDDETSDAYNTNHRWRTEFAMESKSEKVMKLK